MHALSRVNRYGHDDNDNTPRVRSYGRIIMTIRRRAIAIDSTPHLLFKVESALVCSLTPCDPFISAICRCAPC